MRKLASIGLGWAACIALPSGAAAQPVGQPRLPSGKWVVEYADSQCVLSRDYGEGEDRITFAIRFLPLAQRVGLALLMPDREKGAIYEGKVKLVLPPEGRVIESEYHSALSAGGTGRRVVRFAVRPDALKAVASAKAISIDLERQAPTILQADAMEAALKANDLCEIDLLKRWGVDPAVRTLIPRDVGGIWMRNEDYPSLAIRRRLRGNTTILWKVDQHGRIGECRTVQSSGHIILDRTACDAVTKRGRYLPALNGDGVPTAAWVSHIVRWVVP
ncbi:MAG: energy transducer TonB [Sphingobium sp.]|jgi:TonB family protein